MRSEQWKKESTRVEHRAVLTITDTSPKALHATSRQELIINILMAPALCLNNKSVPRVLKRKIATPAASALTQTSLLLSANWMVDATPGEFPCLLPESMVFFKSTFQSIFKFASLYTMPPMVPLG